MALRPALLLLWALLLCLPAALGAQTFPELTGRVVDGAHLLSPDQSQSIEAKLATLEQQTGRQLVVVTLPDLQGYDIADYGYRLGRAWGIGEKDKNTGALLIVAPNERRMRIEAGYGLEGVLTDAASSVIINNTIRPRFKAGDYPGGIQAGVDQIIRVIQLPPDEQRKFAQQAERPRGRTDGGDVITAIAIVGFILFVIFVSVARASMRGGRRYRHGGDGISPIVIWAASEILGEAMRGGRGGGSPWGGDGGWSGGGGGWGDGGGFSGGGGSFGGGGASGDW